MNEFTIQNALYWHLLQKGHAFIVPNIYLGSEESDLISVTKAGYINEYEIKCAKSDFRADFKKHKHGWLQNGRHQNKTISYFWFVIPVGLVEIEEIPDYAGHISVSYNKYYNVCVVKLEKRAKRLSTNKITDRQKNEIFEKFMIRYWKMRTL